MITIGTRLQKRRKELSLTLEQVSDVIKIRPKYLKALEEGDYDIFSSTVYAKGFLKIYSEFLDIDPGKAIAIYRRERSERKQSILAEAQRPIKEPRFVITPVKAIGAFVFILLLGLFGYIYYQYQQFAAPPFLNVVSPKDGDEVVQDNITVEGSTESGSLVTINDQEIKTDDIGNFKVTVSLRPGSNQVKVASENGIGKRSEQIINIFSNVPGLVISERPEEESSEEASKEEEVKEEESKVYNDLELEITIGPNSAWILVETDGETAFAGVLVSDSIKTFTAKEKIYIKTGNAGSTRLKLNGDIQEGLGEEGEVESREYNKNIVLGTTAEEDAT